MSIDSVYFMVGLFLFLTSGILLSRWDLARERRKRREHLANRARGRKSRYHH